MMYQIEMSELRSIITGATSRSLVLIDEICRGTETAKGTCIAGSVVETLDEIGCLGIISTHLHGIFDLPLNAKNVVYKAMSTDCMEGQTIPTWKLIDGVCKESLAFETAKREGVPETIIQRAEELYHSAYSKDAIPRNFESNIKHATGETDVRGPDYVDAQQTDVRQRLVHSKTNPRNQMEILRKEIESAILAICKPKLMKLYKEENSLELPLLKCVVIAAREQPPPSTIGSSSVYLMLRPDRKVYVGQVSHFSAIPVVTFCPSINCSDTNSTKICCSI